MKPILIEYDKILDFFSWFFKVQGITLYPFIIVRKGTSKVTIHHEKIHISQASELFVLGFYILYILDFLKGLLKYRDTHKAYYAIRFEQEAYANERKKDYWKNRKKSAWKAYKI